MDTEISALYNEIMVKSWTFCRGIPSFHAPLWTDLAVTLQFMCVYAVIQTVLYFNMQEKQGRSSVLFFK